MSSRIAAALACFTLFAGSQAAAQSAMPSRRPGLWNQTVEFTHLPGRSVRSQQCVSAGLDPAALRRSLSGDERTACSVRAMRAIGGGVELDMACSGPDGASTTVTRVVGDMSSSYRVESQVRYDNARPGAARDSRMVIRASYAGACPAHLADGERRTVGQADTATGQATGESVPLHLRKPGTDASGNPERH